MPVRLSRLARNADTTCANSLLVSVTRTTGSVTGSAGGKCGASAEQSGQREHAQQGEAALAEGQYNQIQ
jgi:hypothetical protein